MTSAPVTTPSMDGRRCNKCTFSLFHTKPFFICPPNDHGRHTIGCDQCTVKQHKNGQTSDSHTAITPVIFVPSRKHVLALEPEHITPQDCNKKQDCEMAAAKRWVKQYSRRYAPLNTTLLGDDLYSRQPLCEQLIAEGLKVIFAS